MLWPLLVYIAIALLAATFVTIPILRIRTKSLRARILLALAATLFLWGVGGGIYLMLGQPQLAFREALPANQQDLNGAIALMAQRMHENPEPRGLLLLGRAYLTAGDVNSAADVLARAVAMNKDTKDPILLTSYGEALLRQAGKMTPKAEDALLAALSSDPENKPALYLLGLGYAASGEKEKAMRYWSDLLADADLDPSLRREVKARMAILNGPDINAMVEGLARRLKDNPHDAEGWRRLVRAYGVLGETEKRKAALADARRALANDPNGLASVEAEAARTP